MSQTVVLNQNTDFKRLYKKGRSYTNPALVTYLKKNNAGICRIGITSSKKIGNAVERNTSRRKVRAAFYEVQKKYSEELKGYDFIFVCRVRTRFKKSTDIEKIMLEHLKEANIIA
ncbi:MAG: ribonuclease P protein component [Oscillospiraceae bacterium]|nr:ribonuclease P protein component [Candidatus Limimonas coprohippi]MCQ2488380.1 ribonuclease P protein component [Clostridia bacterium]